MIKGKRIFITGGAGGNKFEWDEFTSDFTVVSYAKLKNKLQNNNFYKP